MDVAQVADIVAACEADGAALFPWGGGVERNAGYAPNAARPYGLLATSRLNRILDYQPDDLTITCEPGVTLEELQTALAAGNQFLALDAPLAGQTTLGGLTSAGVSGFWRASYGAPRDLLIGVRAVMTDGAMVKGGGKVVKNVAGYDVCKLFTGAWGTLGVLTELTFKARPRPEAECVLAWAMPDVASAARLALLLHHAQLAPTYLLATNELEDGLPRLVVGLQGAKTRVEWQAAEFARRVGEAGFASAGETLTSEVVTKLRDRQARLDADTPAAARIACLLTALPELVAALENWPGLQITAQAATGIVSLAAQNATPELASAIAALVPAGANLTWTRLEMAPADREKIALWGETRADFALQRALKQTLDPKNTFSPGRFLGRL